MLLGRPWLYSAKVLVDWGDKEFIVGKPPMRIPWKAEKYLGETSDSEGYTSSWTDPEESDSIPSYLVAQFEGTTEVTFALHIQYKKKGIWKIRKSQGRINHHLMTDPCEKSMFHLWPNGSKTGLWRGTYQQMDHRMGYHGVKSGWDQKRAILIESKTSSIQQTTPKSRPERERLSISPTL